MKKNLTIDNIKLSQYIPVVFEFALAADNRKSRCVGSILM